MTYAPVPLGEKSPTLLWNHYTNNRVLSDGERRRARRTGERRAEETVPRSLHVDRNHLPQLLNSSVAEDIPQMARLLWANDPQEPFSPIRLEFDPAAKMVPCNQSQRVSTESSLVSACVGGDSVAEAASR